MKRTILFFNLFLIFITGSLFAIKENKIIRVGYANYEEITAKLTQSGKIVSEIKDLQKSYNNRINSLESEVNSLKQRLENSPSESSINGLVTDFNQKKIELELLKVTAQVEVNKKTESLLEPIKLKIETIVAQKAKQLGFDIIIDSSVVMIGKPSLDITKIILASL